MRTPILIASIMAGSLAAVGKAAAEDDDHDLARDLYEHRQIHALDEVLATARSRAQGEVVSVTLVKDRERWLYLLQIVSPEGHRRTLTVDAGEDAIISDDGVAP